MKPWKRVPFHIDRDPKKPGRTQNWFDLPNLEQALGRKITWVYSNLIEPGKTAGPHYHLEHEVLVWVTSGELGMHLKDVETEEAGTVVVHENSELLSIPAKVYHAGGSVSENPCLAVMFASTQPRDAKDEYFI